jgi:hypothetical protein
MSIFTTPIPVVLWINTSREIKISLIREKSGSVSPSCKWLINQLQNLALFIIHRFNFMNNSNFMRTTMQQFSYFSTHYLQEHHFVVLIASKIFLKFTAKFSPAWFVWVCFHITTIHENSLFVSHTSHKDTEQSTIQRSFCNTWWCNTDSVIASLLNE